MTDSGDKIEIHHAEAAELVQVGALSTTPRGYRVNTTPPAGYSGPRDLDEWNARYDAGTAGGGVS